MKVIEYKLITKEASLNLQFKIEENLLNGYELWGNTFHDGNNYCQAMVKYEKEDIMSGVGVEKTPLE